MTQDELREKLTKDIYEAMQKPYLSERHDAILSLIQQAEVKGKREVLQELLDWHEFYDSQKYTPPRREFDWQAAIENMLLQKDYPHGPIVRLAEFERQRNQGEKTDE